MLACGSSANDAFGSCRATRARAALLFGACGQHVRATATRSRRADAVLSCLCRASPRAGVGLARWRCWRPALRLYRVPDMLGCRFFWSVAFVALIAVVRRSCAAARGADQRIGAALAISSIRGSNRRCCATRPPHRGRGRVLTCWRRATQWRDRRPGGCWRAWARVGRRDHHPRSVWFANLFTYASRRFFVCDTCCAARFPAATAASRLPAQYGRAGAGVCAIFCAEARLRTERRDVRISRYAPPSTAHRHHGQFSSDLRRRPGRIEYLQLVFTLPLERGLDQPRPAGARDHPDELAARMPRAAGARLLGAPVRGWWSRREASTVEAHLLVANHQSVIDICRCPRGAGPLRSCQQERPGCRRGRTRSLPGPSSNAQPRAGPRLRRRRRRCCRGATPLCLFQEGRAPQRRGGAVPGRVVPVGDDSGLRWSGRIEGAAAVRRSRFFRCARHHRVRFGQPLPVRAATAGHWRKLHTHGASSWAPRLMRKRWDVALRSSSSCVSAAGRWSARRSACCCKVKRAAAAWRPLIANPRPS